MKNRTHKNITRDIFPGIDPKIVDQVNNMMDSPEPWMPTFSPELGGMPGLSYRGHRRKGHDLPTAAIIGLRAGGPQGLLAALIHLGLDSTRDQVVKKCGAEVANLLEDGFNLGHDHYKKSTKKKRKAHVDMRHIQESV